MTGHGGEGKERRRRREELASLRSRAVDGDEDGGRAIMPSIL